MTHTRVETACGWLDLPNIPLTPLLSLTPAAYVGHSAGCVSAKAKGRATSFPPRCLLVSAYKVSPKRAE